ncbi:MAG TPA: sugar-binding domain-containing protein [Candidatus Nanopelagicales bacterium]
MIEREESMRLAATMYYLQDEQMDAIARRLGTSRSTVSRLLKAARTSGLVQITVRPEASGASGPAEHLLRSFGVRAHVVPVRVGLGDAERLDQVARVAARLLMDLFDDEMVLGVAWGTTVSAVARALGRKPTRGGTVVQLNGAANTVTSGVDYASTIITAFGAAFDAEVRHFPVPAFFDFAETREAMWRERSVRRVLSVQRRADVALFGVGALGGQVPSHVYSAGYLDDTDLAALYAAGVVGDVCTVFLRGDGSHRDIEINRRATGPTPEELARIPHRLCVVAGEAKLRPLLAAMRAGVVTDLVIDEPTARRLAPRRPHLQRD